MNIELYFFSFGFRFCLLLAFAFLGGCKGEHSRQRMEEAPGSGRQEKQELLEKYGRRVRGNSQNPLLYYQKAKIELEFGDTLEAIASLQKSVQLNDKLPDSWLLLARSSMQLEPVVAEDALKHYHRLQTPSLTFFLLQTDFLVDEEQPEEALQFITEVVRKNPGHPDLLNKKASVELYLKDTAEAVRIYRESLAQYFNREAFDRLFAVYVASGRDRLAVRLLDNLPAEFRGDTRLLAEKAGLFFDHKNWTESQRLYQMLLSEDSLRTDWLNRLAATYLERGRYDSSLLYSQKAERLDSLNTMAWELSANAWNKRGYYWRARKDYRTLLQIDTANAIAKEELAQVEIKIANLRKKRDEQQKESENDSTALNQ
ncbi:MAG: tetratricopeptide repeat protein [Cytophagales bacterium]|nr:tetratricopeptide repeat protein [Cytophagales bacterium]